MELPRHEGIGLGVEIPGEDDIFVYFHFEDGLRVVFCREILFAVHEFVEDESKMVEFGLPRMGFIYDFSFVIIALIGQLLELVVPCQEELVPELPNLDDDFREASIILFLEPEASLVLPDFTLGSLISQRSRDLFITKQREVKYSFWRLYQNNIIELNKINKQSFWSKLIVIARRTLLRNLRQIPKKQLQLIIKLTYIHKLLKQILIRQALVVFQQLNYPLSLLNCVDVVVVLYGFLLLVLMCVL